MYSNVLQQSMKVGFALTSREPPNHCATVKPMFWGSICAMNHRRRLCPASFVSDFLPTAFDSVKKYVLFKSLQYIWLC